VVAVDNRGFGGTSIPGLPEPSWSDSRRYAIRHVVADWQAAIKALGHSSATVAAHDWGGVAGWALAGTLGPALDGLIILNAPASSVYSRNAGFAQYVRSLYIAMFQVPWLPEFWMTRGNGSALRNVLLGNRMGLRRRTGPLAVTDADAEVYAHAFSQPGGVTGAVNWYRQLGDLSFEDNARMLPTPRKPLTAPVVIMWGTEDGALGTELIPGHEKLCTNLQVRLLPGCSHWAQQDHVEEVVTEAAKFLRADAQAAVKACYDAAAAVTASEAAAAKQGAAAAGKPAASGGKGKTEL
jgi:pimeloyl-ACP methyl ester carboxylesterase